MFKDYYKILGIQQSASAEEVKSAYRSMSIKWHPDKNQGVDVTHIMQDINEAYAILKDPDKRLRYDREYLSFQEQRYSHQVQPNDNASSSNSWDYNYEVRDEDLRDDIKEARQTAEELVNEFLNSLKTASKQAVKGAWDGAKGYIYAGIALSIIGLVVATCVHLSANDRTTSYDYDYTNGAKQNVEATSPFQTPPSWAKYYIDNGAFSINIPPTMELRDNDDAYTQRIKDMGVACNTDIVTFQQKGLSANSKKAMKHYCRVLIQHNTGNSGDFLRHDETEPIDEEAENVLHDMVVSELDPYSLIGEPTYKWIDINGTKAIETKYRRSGSEGNATSCTIYLLFNYDEMVKMIVSYRELEKELWQPDLDNVIKTFKWK